MISHWLTVLSPYFCAIVAFVAGWEVRAKKRLSRKLLRALRDLRFFRRLECAFLDDMIEMEHGWTTPHHTRESLKRVYRQKIREELQYGLSPLSEPARLEREIDRHE
jgi:hypothetical protein